MRAKVILEVLSGPIEGKVFVFENHDTFLFGRRRDCHAQIPKDGYVSRHHFILEVNPPDARIRDLGSRNGTYVNGAKYGGREEGERPEDAAARQYPEVDLKQGDQIAAGQTTILVRVELSVQCSQCGMEVPEAERQQAERLTESYLCAGCRLDMATQPRPAMAIEKPCCQRCGKDVTDEVCDRRGQYVCQECQSSLMAEDDGLRRLMQEAVRGARGSKGPEIGDYDLGEELGRGGMGVVYRALRKADGRPVAVKIMLAKIAVDARSREMFQREIDVTRQLDHANVVRLLDHGSAEGAFYFVMEYCNRGSLDVLARRHGGKLPLDAATPIMLQCLEGLQHAHQLKFIHRDLKPQNILLDERDGLRLAKISDFGLAKNFEQAGFSGMTATGRLGGTYHFMPREQLTHFKYFLPVSDLWSMAATFYHLLCGHSPLDFPKGRDPMEVILHDEPVPLRRREPSIPEAVAKAIDRTLSTDPGQRYPTALEMEEALRNALEQSRS